MIRGFWLLVAVLALAGCRSRPPELLPHSPRLMIAQNSDGDATMSWESEEGYLYTIFLRDGEAPWRELPSCVRCRGTGGTMVAHDRVTHSRPTMRRYRLHFEKQP